MKPATPGNKETRRAFRPVAGVNEDNRQHTPPVYASQDLCGIERAVLGTCLAEPQRAGELVPMLSADLFIDPVCRAVAAGIIETHSEGRPIDADSVWMTLQGKKNCSANRIGLDDLIDCAQEYAVLSHIRTLQAARDQRRRAEIARALAGAAESGGDISRLVDELQALNQCVECGSGEAGFMQLRASLWRLSNEKGLSVSEKNRRAGDAVCAWLNQRGSFYFHADLRDFSSAMFFDRVEKVLRRVQSDAFQAWLADAMAVNRAESVFRFTASAIENEALNGQHTRAILPAEYWHTVPGATYISSGPGRVCRIRADGIALCDNGTDGVVFSEGATLAPWTLTDAVNPFDECRVFRDAAFVGDHGKDLFTLWACGIFTHQRTKPPLCLSGTVGSGKTRLAVALFELMGLQPRISAITKNGESDFWAQVSSGGLVTFDNADTKTDWFADSLAAAATDGGHEKRRLYTDAERVYLRARSWVIVTSANPTFASDAGLSDRLIVVRLDRRTADTAESALSDEIAACRDAGLSWIAQAVQRALADSETPPSVLNRRHPDHGTACFRIGRAIGREYEAVKALRAAEDDKGLFNLENDPLGSALLELTSNSEGGRLSGTAAEISDLIIAQDAFWDGKLSAKSFSKRVAKIWPHLESCLYAREYPDPHSKIRTYVFARGES